VPRKEDGQHEWSVVVPHRGTQPTGQVAQNDVKRDPAAEAQCQGWDRAGGGQRGDAGAAKLHAGTGTVKQPGKYLRAMHSAPARPACADAVRGHHRLRTAARHA
jgi:hypothetical protein